MTRQTLLEARDLSHVYPNANGGLGALEHVNLTIERDSFVCVVGPSGSGKTTLLRLLSGLLTPTAGSILFEGEPLDRPRRRIGFVFQQANLMPWRTAEANVRLPLEIQPEANSDPALRARAMLELVGLTGFEGAYPRDLSGGMAQRVALARALVHAPDLLLMDEPFGSLDALTRELMIGELLRIWRQRAVTILMVTHSVSEAVLMADRVIVLSERPGSVVLDLPVDLPRPRDLEMVYTAPFGRLADQVRRAVYGRATAPSQSSEPIPFD
ncbi:MAG TPA: ABC transporter ATP-binding protein [Anaerolineales bacterium]|jgi:NitT/TauT family transport system ATP-binding protein